MKIAVVGTGHVGLTTAACLAHVGHDVLGIDDNPEKVDAIGRGEMPFYEPGLADIVRAGLASGRLTVSSDVAQAARFGEVVFVCVGTPTRDTGEPDLTQVDRVARTIAENLDGYTVIVEKSTVPVGTGERLRRTVEVTAPETAEFDVASNPEFLQEGYAIRDTLEPGRIVFGSDSERAVAVLMEVYRPIINRSDCPVIVTDIATAELIKHTSNAFLGMKISFINKIAEICDRTGADVDTLAAAVGMDPRIGRDFLRAGIGYGGACLPKDVKAFAFTSEKLGVDSLLLATIDYINRSVRGRFVERIAEALIDPVDKRIGVWGLAFKPETDDLRNAPALDVVRDLVSMGAVVTAHDPVAMGDAKALLPDIAFADDPYDAARDADCLVICTEWDIYASTDLARLRASMASPLIVDGRNIFEREEMERAGFRYLSVGRPAVGVNPG